MGMEFRLDESASNDSMLGIIPAIPNGPLYCNVFGGDRARPGRNLTPRRPQARAVGRSVSNGQWTVLDENNYIDTGIPNQDALTIILMAGVSPGQPTGSQFCYFVGSYPPDGTSGTNLLIYGGSSSNPLTSLVGRKQSNGTITSESVGGVDAHTFQAVCLRVSSTYATRFDDLKTGLTSVAPNPVLARSVSPGNLLLGRAPNPIIGLYAPVNMVAVAIYGRVLTDAELAKAYGQMALIVRDQNVPGLT